MTTSLPTTMTAIVSPRALPISDESSLVETTVAIPALRPHDILVRVEAVSVNPVDVKTRAAAHDSLKTLGYDAAGTVVAIGPQVQTYAVGDEVYYAGSILRPGSNADYQAVDERIVGRKPRTLGFADAAAMPLTTITAWEVLFDRLGLTASSTGTLLVVASAGGVGSILTQLANHLTKATIIGTASRPESSAFATSMGADHVIDHHGDLAAAVQAIAPTGTDWIFSPHTASNLDAYAAAGKPFSAVAAIDDPNTLSMAALKNKSMSLHWESMFTRSSLETADMVEQQRLLTRAAELLDAGTLVSTRTTTLEGFTAANLREAHRLVEAGDMVGKVVVAR